MAHCEGPIPVPDKRLRWLCQGARNTLRVEAFKKLLSFKPWCVEGTVIRGAYQDPVGAQCFKSQAEADAYRKSLQTSTPLSGLCRCRRRR